MNFGTKELPWGGLLLALCLGAGPEKARAATTNISYGSFFFNPKAVHIQVGDTINWNSGSGSHTLLGLGSDPICGGAALPCSHTFNTSGSYAYECTVPGHAGAGMTGLVVVAGAPIMPAVLTNATHLANGQFRFTIITTANRTNIIQASTDLGSPANWVSINTNIPTTNRFDFTDINAGSLRLRFYRIVEPP